VAIDTPDRLRSAIRSSQFVEMSMEGSVSAGELEELPGVSSVERAGDRWHLLTGDPGRTAEGVVDLARGSGRTLKHICTRKPSLEEVFLHLTESGEA
jgi:hypothetical protein